MNFDELWWALVGSGGLHWALMDFGGLFDVLSWPHPLTLIRKCGVYGNNTLVFQNLKIQKSGDFPQTKISKIYYCYNINSRPLGRPFLILFLILLIKLTPKTKSLFSPNNVIRFQPFFPYFHHYHTPRICG